MKIELELKRLHARRVTQLEAAEFELLCALPGVAAAVKREDYPSPWKYLGVRAPSATHSATPSTPSRRRTRG